LFKLRAQKGFQLIEVVVIILIIGVISSVGMLRPSKLSDIEIEGEASSLLSFLNTVSLHSMSSSSTELTTFNGVLTLNPCQGSVCSYTVNKGFLLPSHSNIVVSENGQMQVCEDMCEFLLQDASETRNVCLNINGAAFLC
jgi:type II secretory pathway pseudopilin PulG